MNQGCSGRKTADGHYEWEIDRVLERVPHGVFIQTTGVLLELQVVFLFTHKCFRRAYTHNGLVVGTCKQ